MNSRPIPREYRIWLDHLHCIPRVTMGIADNEPEDGSRLISSPNKIIESLGCGAGGAGAAGGPREAFSDRRPALRVARVYQDAKTHVPVKRNISAIASVFNPTGAEVVRILTVIYDALVIPYRSGKAIPKCHTHKRVIIDV